MRKMKNSGIEWIGEIPEDWEVGRIGELYTERKEKVSDKDFMPLSVTMKGILPQLASAAKSDAHDDRKLVRKGDFAINSRSDRRGSCGISDYDGSVSLINTILTPRNNMNPNYYNWLFHTTLFADEFYKWGHGIVDDLWTTNWSDMKNITIPVPLVTTQQQIADFLDKKCSEIDSVISKTRETIEEYKKLKHSIITEVVTGNVKIENGKVCGKYDTYKDSGIEWIGEIPSEWEVIKCKHLLEVKSGDAIRNELLSSNGKYQVFGGGEILGYTDVYNANESNLLIGRVGARCGCVTRPFNKVFATDNALVVIPKDNRNFLYYVFISFDLNRLNTSNAQPLITSSKVKNITIPVPLVTTQQQISDFLDKKCSEIDKLITKKEQLVVELESYKKSLIYEVVTGKKEMC